MTTVIRASDERWFRHEVWEYEGSAGDRVAVDAWLSHEPGPVVIAGHGAESDRRAQYLTGAAKAWARKGFSVIAADAPGHGERADPDLPPPTMRDIHRIPFVAQAAADLRRLADRVAERFGDDAPLGYLGFSMGTQYGVPAVADEPRFAAAVFCIGGSTSVALPQLFPSADREVIESVAGIDPVVRAGEVAPRPVLMVNADNDEVFSRDSALALYDAFGSPKELSFFPGKHVEWESPAQWYRRMEGFLRRHLGMTSR